MSIFADRLQHSEARLTVWLLDLLDQVLFDQRRQAAEYATIQFDLKIGINDRFSGFH